MAANPAAGSTSSLTGSASFQKSYAVKNFNEFTEAAGDMGSSNKINLVSIGKRLNNSPKISRLF